MDKGRRAEDGFESSRLVRGEWQVTKGTRRLSSFISRLPSLTSRLSPLASRLSPLAPRLLPLWLGGAALVVYLLTMAPVLTWGYKYLGRDGGDFISAAWFSGVPHPTGYPTYTMLAWLFTRLSFGSVAWRVHLISGFAGAGTVALTYLVGRWFASHSSGRLIAGALGAAVGALLLAFAPLFWSHSLIAEVYALHLLFIALILWLTLRWRNGDGPLPLAALAFGVGMGNHVTLTFLGPTVLLLLWSGRERLSWRAVFLSALALVAGLLVYLYLPWRAATDPLINWGDPDTWEGFWWMISGRGYRRFFFALPRDELLPRLEEWWNLSGDQFTPLAWPLALLGLWELARRDRWLALGSLIHAALNLVYSIGYDVSDAFVYLLPVYFYLALWMGQGAASLSDVAYQLCKPGVRLIVDTYWLKRPAGKKHRAPMHSAVRNALVASALLVAVVVGLLLLPLASLVQEWGEMDLTRDLRAQAYAQEALEVVEPGALILVGSDVHTFTLWYYHYVEELRPDVAVINYPMLNFEWYTHTVAVHHPDVALPGPDVAHVRKLDAILYNLDQRPVYIAEDEGDLADLQLTPVGPLWRVTAP